MDGHVCGDSIVDEPGQSTSWLWDDNNSIDKCVNNASHCPDAEQHDRESSRGIGQDIKETTEKEGNDILQVILVSPSHTFHVRVVIFDFQFLRRQILGIRECLE